MHRDVGGDDGGSKSRDRKQHVKNPSNWEAQKRKPNQFTTLKRELLGRSVKKDHCGSTIDMKVIKVVQEKQADGLTKRGLSKYRKTYFCDPQSYDGNNVFSKKVPLDQVRAMLLPENVQPEMDIYSIPDAPYRKKSRNPISAHIEENGQEQDEPMKPLITRITPKKLSKRAHEATGCETPPFLLPRGIQNHHKKKAYEHEHTGRKECEECVDEDEDAVFKRRKLCITMVIQSFRRLNTAGRLILPMGSNSLKRMLSHLPDKFSVTTN